MQKLNLFVDSYRCQIWYLTKPILLPKIQFLQLLMITFLFSRLIKISLTTEIKEFSRTILSKTGYFYEFKIIDQLDHQIICSFDSRPDPIGLCTFIKNLYSRKFIIPSTDFFGPNAFYLFHELFLWLTLLVVLLK